VDDLAAPNPEAGYGCKKNEVRDLTCTRGSLTRYKAKKPACLAPAPATTRSELESVTSSTDQSRVTWAGTIDGRLTVNGGEREYVIEN